MGIDNQRPNENNEKPKTPEEKGVLETRSPLGSVLAPEFNESDYKIARVVADIEADMGLLDDPETQMIIKNNLSKSEDGSLPKDIALNWASRDGSYLYVLLMNYKKVDDLGVNDCVDLALKANNSALLEKFLQTGSSYFDAEKINNLSKDSIESIFAMENGEKSKLWNIQYAIIKASLDKTGASSVLSLDKVKIFIENAKETAYFEETCKMLVDNINKIEGVSWKDLWEILKANGQDKLADEVVRKG